MVRGVWNRRSQMKETVRIEIEKLRAGSISSGCAIYTRKSTEEGLDQDFNTVQAQRESAEAYIA
jgi:hypothetical protein